MVLGIGSDIGTGWWGQVKHGRLCDDVVGRRENE
jgi:hypothetical protein